MQRIIKVLFQLMLGFVLVINGLSLTPWASGVSVTTSGSVSVLERTPVVVDRGIMVSFPETINGVLVSIQNGAPGDVLASEFEACNYNETTFVLTCSGDFTALEAEALFRGVTFFTTASDITPRQIDFVLGKALPEPTTGRFYEFFEANVTWEQALNIAEEKSLFGLKGYLATIPNQAVNDFITTKINADPWVAGSDDYRMINYAVGENIYPNQGAAEGYWYWIAGPEKGQMFYNHRTSEELVYENWANGEPNNVGYNGEHFLQLYSGNQGQWNDLPNNSTLSYVVAYGGFDNDPEVNLVATATINIKPLVNYVDNGATSGSVPVDPIEYEVGDEVSVLANLNLSKEGALFIGWSPNESGFPLYQANDIFELTSRLTLYAMWFEFALEEDVRYYGLGRSSETINYVEADGSVFSKAEVLFELKEGDVITSSYESGEYSYWYYDPIEDNYFEQVYTLTLTRNADSLVFETNVPIPANEFVNILNYLEFSTTGEMGPREFTYRVHVGDSLMEDTSIMQVVETLTITYESEEYQAFMPVDEGSYLPNDMFCPMTPYNLSDAGIEGKLFIGWRDQYGRFILVENRCYGFKESLVLTPVLISIEDFNSSDKLFESDFVEDGTYILPEGYLESEFSWLVEYYSYYKLLLVVNHEAFNDFDDDELSEFMDFYNTQSNKGVQFFFIKPVILYYEEGNVFPYSSNLSFYGDFEAGIEMSFVIPLKDRGFTNYRLFHLEEDEEDTELEFTLDPLTWTITFTTHQFSPFALMYDVPESIDEEEPPVDDDEEEDPPVDEEEDNEQLPETHDQDSRAWMLLSLGGLLVLISKKRHSIKIV